MKKLFYMATILLFLLNLVHIPAQKNSEPIFVNTKIGDTLSLSERNYYQLFPKIDDFQFAVFYLSPDSMLNAEVHYFKNGTTADTLIQNYKSLKSFNYQISARLALENQTIMPDIQYKNSYSDKGADVSVYRNDGDIISGELLSVKNNSMLVLKQECIEIAMESDCTEKINTSEINKLIIVGNSNLGEGIILGLLAAAAVAAVIYLSNENNSILNEDSGELIGITSLGCIALGVTIGILTSTPDKVIDPFSEDDISGLSTYSRFKKKK